MKEFDVLVVGELNVDLIANRIEGYPAMSKEILARDFVLTTGSSSAIFANNISTLGAKVAFCGVVGDDLFGHMIINQLRSKDINTDYIYKRTDIGTGATTVLNYGNDRMMVTYPGPMEDLVSTDVPDELLDRVKHLHISSIFLQVGIRKSLLDLLFRAKTKGVSISIDPQWDPSEQWDLDLKELLQVIDVFLPNRKEFLLLTNEKSLQTAIEKHTNGNCILVVKDGENGALWSKDATVSKQPAYLNTQVVDSIGAGDSFDAGFISQFILGKSIPECVKFGNLIGAISTTAAGGTGAFESLTHVINSVKEKFSVEIENL